jgi:PAS domain S-box-containing protein
MSNPLHSAARAVSELAGPLEAADRLAAERLVPEADHLPALDLVGRLATRLLAGGAGLPPGALGSRTPLRESLCTVTAEGHAPLVVPEAPTDARVATLPPVTSGMVGSYLGVPLVVTADGVPRTVGALCVFDRAPRAWTAEHVGVLEQLAEWVVTELEAAALSAEHEVEVARSEMAVAAAGIGSFDWDILGERLIGDARLLELFGIQPGTEREVVESFLARIHPDDRDRVEHGIQRAIDAADAYEGEYRVVLPAGEERWVRVRGRVLPDEQGRPARMVGAALDTTDVRDASVRVVRVLESMSAGFVTLDRGWRLTYVNPEAERILGMSREELLGQDYWELFPATVGTVYEETYRRAIETGRPQTLEAYYPAPLNAWFEIRATPTADGLSLYFLDVSARRETRELVDLSAMVSDRLAGSLDLREAVQALACLVVPRLADWAMVTVIDPDGTARDVAGWHVDPDLRVLVERYRATRGDGSQRNGTATQVLESGRPLVIEQGAMELGLELLRSEEAAEVLRTLAPSSASVVPLTANGRMRGTLTLCRGADRPPLSDEELTVAVSVAQRAGLAVDNARLYDEQRLTAERLQEAYQRLQDVAEHDRTVAEALQGAMLTHLPEPDHLHVAARYKTASGGEQVGGDWYDALVLPSGATTLVIGDVVGHDIGAAAIMGQLRNMLRTLAWDRDETPSRTLSRLDRAMADLRLDTVATALVLQVEQTPSDERAGNRTLRWTSAGHPAPVLLPADGPPELLEEAPDLLLGLDPTTPRSDHTHVAPSGSTLLLYTDGLVETRRADVRAGQQRLLETLDAHRDLPLEELLDVVLAELVGDQPEDDVALLAVRFHPEDEPRPAEAGPEHL